MFEMLIDGQAVSAGPQISVINPVTEQVVADVPDAGPTDVDRAVAAARLAWPGWRATGFAQRRSVLQAMSRAVADNGAELAELLVQETGRPMGVAQFEVGLAQQFLDYYAEQELLPEVLIDDATRRVELRRQPLGVCAAIVPWNAPFYLAVNKIAPALMAGNTIVVKTAPTTPLTTARFGMLVADLVPAGVLNILSGGNATGAHLVGHPDVAKVSFTGSTQTGRLIMAAAAPTLKRLTLELGGNDAAIVLPDVDPVAIAPALFGFAFFNSGQVCAVIKRLYVHDSIYDAVCGAMAAIAGAVTLGDGGDPALQLGPLQNKAQYEKVQTFLADAGANGTIIAGGNVPDRTGYFIEPTIVRDIAEGTMLVDDEPFGPILPIIRYSDVDDAIARANNSPYGLGASVWSADVDAATQVAARIESGTVWVNQHCALDPAVPFPASKQSGIGAEGGREGLYAYTSLQTVNIARGQG